MPVQHMRNRRAFNCSAPKFELGNVPPRCLHPMEAVSTDSLGTTSYAVQGSGHSSPASQEAQSELHPQCPTLFADQDGCPNLVASNCATCVLPHLYLGGQGDASCCRLLRKLNIRRILNVAGECPCLGDMPSSAESGPDSADREQLHSSIQTKHIEIRDHSDENIAEHFQEALQFIHEGIQQDETVLVHCRFGVSRSATIVMAYLMQYGIDEQCPATPPTSSGSSISTPGLSKMGSRESSAGSPTSSILGCTPPLSTAGSTASSAGGRGLTYEESFDYVKARRPQVSPNLGFVLALHELDRIHREQQEMTQNQQQQNQQQQDVGCAAANQSHSNQPQGPAAGLVC